MSTQLQLVRRIMQGKDLKIKASLISLLAITLVFRMRRSRKVGHAIDKDDLGRAMRMVYERNPDGSKTLLVPFRGKVKKVRALST